jgi:hypothetical protein
MPELICKGIPEVPFYHDKPFKCTLTGLTRLKEGRYKSRYQLGGGYANTAQGHIIEKPKTAPVSKLSKLSAGEKRYQKPRKNTYGIAKQIIRNRMRAMVNMLQQSTARIRKPKLYFFTVSFLAGTADDLCYQVYNTWLTELRQQGLLLSYLWVAERQKNGTIHYHLAIPHYMNTPKANRIMRKILMDQKNKGNLPDWDRKKLMKYNGVDIAKNRDTKRPVNFASNKKQKALAQYLTKYITKNDTEMNRLAWHCSRDWSALIIGMSFTRSELGKFVTGRMLDRDTLETEYAEFYRWTNFKPPEKFARHLGEMNYDLLHYVTGKKTDILFQLSKN